MNVCKRVMTGVGVAAALSIACSQTPTLATQVSGWWMDPQSGACFCPQQAECAGGDCVSYAVFGLLADNRYVEGSIAYSASVGTMSTVGTLLAGTFKVGDGSVIVSQPNVADTTLPVSFSSTGEAHFGTRIEVRPSPTIAAALDKASAGGTLTWKSYPVSH